MTNLFASRPFSMATPVSITLDAARCWRGAHDHGAPILPTLLEMLEIQRCGQLAPVFDSVMSLYEACCGRRLRIEKVGCVSFSGDERRLLQLVARTKPFTTGIVEIKGSPGLAAIMRVALRSTRFLIAQTLQRMPDEGSLRRAGHLLAC